MDPIGLLKGRMAEALVEAVFKRAKYTVARVGRETQVPALVRTGRAEFMPDFVVWRALDEQMLAVEVKYRADLEDYLRRDSPWRSAEVVQRWPELYEIIVTDRPESGRSCFQVIHVSDLADGIPPVTRDLHQVPGLDIYRRTVEEYEGLVREIFPIIGSRQGSRQARVEIERKSGAWMPGRSAGHRHRRARPAGDPHRYRPSVVSEHRPGASE